MHAWMPTLSTRNWSAIDAISDWSSIASTLAEFLTALHRVDYLGGPEPGPHNFFRGSPLSVYGDETAAAIEVLGTEIDHPAVERVWSTATATHWTQRPAWFHGDVAPTNLLTCKGQLAAVIDFGTSGVGDPACDTVIAWTHLDTSSRATFQRIIGLDSDTWARGRGWALWKALITLTDQLDSNDDVGASISRAIINGTVTDAAISR
jgi:aminoglycoside phosphotransferase (APT) family kinase protein